MTIGDHLHDFAHTSDEELSWRLRIYDSLSFPSLILKPNQEVISVNQPFLERYNLTTEEVIGKKCSELQHVNSGICQEPDCPIRQVVRDKISHSTIRRVFDQDGVEKWEDRFFSPILNNDGELLYIMESLRDITRLKTLEKTLRETENFLEKVVQSSASAIIAADMEGDLLFANQAAYSLLGIKGQKEISNFTAKSLYPPGQAQEIMNMLRDGELGGVGKLPPTRNTIITAQGEGIPVEITASIIYEEGREVATMAIYNDLREKIAAEEKLKTAQQQLAQAEKLASMGQLAAGVAHEINNPLAGILIYTNLVLESLKENDPAREQLEFVVEDVYRCKEIVKNLLAYSRQQSPSWTIIHLNDLVEQSLYLIRDQKIFNQIKVVKQFSEEMMLVNVDRNQLNQIIINLVMNALAAMDGNGTLTFRTYRKKRAKKVFLEVEDTGCGIPDDILPKIFDPFFTTKDLGKGTGLGLSTVYGLVQENNGNISVKETGLDGTIFLLELPMYMPTGDEVIPLSFQDKKGQDIGYG